MTEKKTLNEEDLTKVSGGKSSDETTVKRANYHIGCKGRVVTSNRDTPFASSHCLKCGLSTTPDKIDVYGIAVLENNEYMITTYNENGRVKRQEVIKVRPEELDWPCNQ